MDHDRNNNMSHNGYDSDEGDDINANYARRSSALPPPSQLYTGGTYDTGATGAMFRSMAITRSMPVIQFGGVPTSGSSSDELERSSFSPQKYLSGVTEHTPPRPFDFEVLKRTEAAKAPWVWEITSLRRVPMYHPIDRNALELDGVSCEQVAARISNFFRANSVTCSYHVQEPGRADCLTQGLLKFSVQLWKGKNDKIIMEVQRRQGCSIEMQNLRCRLYRSVQDGEEAIKIETSDPESYNAAREFSDRIFRLAGAPMEGVGAESAFSNFPSPFEICFELMSSKLLDQNRLGLESLCTMTDPSKVVSSESDKLSRMLLCGDENGVTKLRDIFARYFDGVELQGMAPSTVRMSDDDDDLLRYSEGQFVGANHVLALRALSNALESVSWQKEHGHAESVAWDHNPLFWRPVVKALVYNLKIAEQRPIEAALSVKCIRLLQGLEPTALSETAAQLFPHLENAYRFGRAHNLWLQQESAQLLERLAKAQ